jgi:hypothetical protein
MESPSGSWRIPMNSPEVKCVDTTEILVNDSQHRKTFNKKARQCNLTGLFKNRIKLNY